MGTKGISMKSMDDQMMAAMNIPNKDKSFLKGMIAHHEGAIQMCDDEIRHGKNQAAIAMAKKIRSQQVQEVQKMQRILKSLG